VEAIAVLLLAVGLAMDAFAVSVCKGLAIGKSSVRAGLIVGAWFGFFQFLMPVIGFYIGSSFSGIIEDYDHWVAFILLALIGANMIRESFKGEDEDMSGSLGFRNMLFFAIATSIDALASGISLAMTEDSIWMPAVAIGVVTFLMSFVGTYIGCKAGSRLGPTAELIGGIILILIGISVPLEHLGYI
jgi:putative Mn2+ efflux pump MntP